MTRAPRLLFVEPVLNPPGGSSCVAAWALQALRDDYAIDLLTWEPVDFDQINRFYGTTLDATEYTRMHAPAWLRRLVALDPDPYSVQPAAFLMRAAKLIQRRYALTLGFFDETDLGARSLQYIHFPYMGRIYREEQRLERMPGILGKWRAFQYRLRPWRLLAGYSFERVKRNLTLTNSDWTAEWIAREFGIPAQTLYPPVPGNFPDVPWESRENGFVSIGRISPEKRFDQMIAILARVRAAGHAVHLHIIGALGEEKHFRTYYRRVRDLVEEHSAWVSLHENISHAELAELVAQHRYGIHAMIDEHFGIAVAEMVRGGCIVFVPDSGGQVEIIGDEPQLQYASNQAAVEKILRVLGDEAAQQTLHNSLTERGKQFAPQYFMERLRSILGEILA